MQKSYKLSIITVCRNDLANLKKTLTSVASQDFADLEVIVVDGNSNDGTREFLQTYETDLQLTWVSESDAGIYDAMNKGLDLAGGEYLLFLNAGDYFVGKVLDNDMPLPCFLPVHYIFLKIYRREIPIKKHYDQGLPNCHQGIIFKKSDVRYNLEYKISSDYDYFLRQKIKPIDCFIPPDGGHIFFAPNGLSSQHSRDRDEEIATIIKKRFGLIPWCLFQSRARSKRLIKRVISAFNI